MKLAVMAHTSAVPGLKDQFAGKQETTATCLLGGSQPSP